MSSLPTITPQHIRTALLARDELALLDVRHEAEFAIAHPLFAANMAANRIALEAELRLPRKNVPIVLYDNGEGFVPVAAEAFAKLGYTNFRALAGGLKAWRDAAHKSPAKTSRRRKSMS
jgi:rhodanese-related sulfurtransferase